MSAAEALLSGRELAEEQMVDTCTLRGPDVKGPLDEVTGQYPLTPGPVIYTGPCQFQTTDTIGHDVEASDRIVTTVRFVLKLPMSAPQAAVGQVATCDSSLLDPQLPGKRFQITSLIQKSYMTARRLEVKEVQT